LIQASWQHDNTPPGTLPHLFTFLFF